MQVDFSTTYELHWEAAPGTTRLMYTRTWGWSHMAQYYETGAHILGQRIFRSYQTPLILSPSPCEVEHFVFSVIIFVTCCCSWQLSSFSRFLFALESSFRVSFLSLQQQVTTMWWHWGRSLCHAELVANETSFHRCEMALSLARATAGKAWKWTAIVVVFLFTIQPLLLSCLKYIHILFTYHAIFQIKWNTF